MRSYRDLAAWQRAMEVIEEVYRLASMLPKEEVYGLRSQLTRAAVSIACNIAEGQGRMADREFAQYLRIARGSSTELQTLLELVVRIKLFDHSQVSRAEQLADDCSRLIAGLLRKIQRDLQA